YALSPCNTISGRGRGLSGSLSTTFFRTDKLFSRSVSVARLRTTGQWLNPGFSIAGGLKGRPQAKRLPQLSEDAAVFNYVFQPELERHLAPLDRALYQIRDRAVRLVQPKVLGNLGEPAIRILASADRADSVNSAFRGAVTVLDAVGLCAHRRIRRVGLRD